MSPSSSISNSNRSSSATSTTGTSLVVRPTGSCPHEIRPGTTVCLHCRQAERAARGERRRRTAARFGLAAAGLAVCAVVANAAAGAFDLRMPKLASRHARAARALANRTGSGGGGAEARDTAAPSYGAADPSVIGASGASGAAARPALSPIVAEGRSTLRRGPAVAVRAGEVVTVQFDTPETRTRRADKFEAIVRATLPGIYGPAADSALARVPAGTLTAPGALVTELPARGVRLALGPAPSSGAIVIWPETRPGQDGPLVVSYRTVVSR